MYTKQETSKKKQEFWTAFGRYMKPVLSADGEEISWSNYKTGNKHIRFKMDVDTRQAVISIVLDHPEPETRRSHFERFSQLKAIFEETLGESDWVASEEGTIEKRLGGVNVFRNEDWPAVISFLKPRIIALDAFWSMVRFQFSPL
ncbi:MAG TPA: DUF4268 domain-containing protein [Puia sp.]